MPERNNSIPVFRCIDWMPDDLLIDISNRGYDVRRVARLGGDDPDVDWVVDHLDRVLYLADDLSVTALRHAVNLAHRDVLDHQPLALPPDERRSVPADLLTPPSDPEPADDEAVEKFFDFWYWELHALADAAATAPVQDAARAALAWFCGLPTADQLGHWRALLDERARRLSPAVAFWQRPPHRLHVTLPPDLIREIAAQYGKAGRARAEGLEGPFVGGVFEAAFTSFAQLDEGERLRWMAAAADGFEKARAA